jgi:hypothetical protein
VCSYQRIFRPERRIYSIEGRALPVPGGIPLRWLAYACGTIVAVLVVTSRSSALDLLLAAVAGLAGAGRGGNKAAALAAFVAFLGLELAGWLLMALDWPLRLVVLPVAVASLATQGTPDGRAPERFAASWLALRLAPRRSSLGRPLPGRETGDEVWVAADEHAPELRRARLHGPCRVAFGRPVEHLGRGRRAAVRRLGWRARRGRVVEALELGTGERLEGRP